MAESSFLRAEMDNMRAKHKGNIILIAEYMASIKLLEFFNSIKAKKVKDNCAYGWVTDDTIIADESRAHTVPASGDTQYSAKVDGEDWSMVVRSVVLKRCNGYAPAYIISTKIKPDKFVSRLSKFVRDMEHDTRTVHVIGDMDIAKPKHTWDDIVLPADQMEMLRNTTESFFSSKAKAAYKSMGLPYKRGILLMGPPGQGKTLTTRILLSLPDVCGYVLPVKNHMEDDDIRRAFTTAGSCSGPSVLVIEDLDRLGSTNANLGYLLNQMDGIRSYSGILVVATANNPENIDSALLHRPSRFDTIVQFGLPAEAERREYINRLAAKADNPFSNEVINQVVRDSGGMTMAYIQEVVTSALLTSLHRGVKLSDELLTKSCADVKRQLKNSDRYKVLDKTEKASKVVGFDCGEAGRAN